MYIAFEGIEGSGKSVQIDILKNFFEKKGLKYIITKEPGSTDIGTEIRKILLNGSFTNMGHLTEIFLYLADRAEHYDKIIKPNLNKVDVIISDRSLYSTLVYQGFGRGIDMNLLKQLNGIVTENIFPDYVFLIDLPVEIGLERALKREETSKNNQDRFEKERIDFHYKIREGYQFFYKNSKDWFIFDGKKSIEDISSEIEKTIEKLLCQR